MNMKNLAPNVYVCAQITPADLGVAAAHGIQTVVNNRPDAEGPDQPASAALAAVATGLGLHYEHIPIVGGAIDAEDVARFRACMDDGPVLAFCRSGMRSAALWALAAAASDDPERILQATADAGYDLAALRPRLRAARDHD